jgi:hypothetical protein
MKTSRRHLLLCVPVTVAAASVLTAQETKVSPAATAEIKLKNKPVTIAYSRPYKKGRKIMGGLVPYGRVWRTGADDATSLKTAVDLEIGGTTVPAGSYTLYTLPSETTWKLIINKQTGQWGTEYDQSQDLARVNLTKSSLPSPIEQFTIEFVKLSGDSADLILEWETTKLSVPVRAK